MAVAEVVVDGVAAASIGVDVGCTLVASISTIVGVGCRYLFVRTSFVSFCVLCLFVESELNE